MTVLNVSATLGSVTSRIASRADKSAACPWSSVVCISNRRQGRECNLWSGYHSRSSPTILVTLLCAKITHSLQLCHQQMDSGNPSTTFSVTNLQNIAAATEVKVFPRPISSATSAPGISAFQTHLLMMNHLAQSWCARNLVLGRPGIEHLWPGTRSSVYWRRWWALSCLTASSRHSYSNLSLIVLGTVCNTELVCAGSRTSSPFTTCSWTSLAPLSVFISSLMITSSCSDACYADGLIFRCSWNS